MAFTAHCDATFETEAKLVRHVKTCGICKRLIRAEKARQDHEREVQRRLDQLDQEKEGA